MPRSPAALTVADRRPLLMARCKVRRSIPAALAAALVDRIDVCVKHRQRVSDA
ncbi:MAG: hypothetical protein R3F37_22950 [Candidatus Competibacteraceae bacterium]